MDFCMKCWIGITFVHFSKSGTTIWLWRYFHWSQVSAGLGKNAGFRPVLEPDSYTAVDETPVTQPPRPPSLDSVVSQDVLLVMKQSACLSWCCQWRRLPIACWLWLSLATRRQMWNWAVLSVSSPTGHDWGTGSCASWSTGKQCQSIDFHQMWNKQRCSGTASLFVGKWQRVIDSQL